MIPDLLILDITHRCNLKCRICDIWQTGLAEMDMDLGSVKNLLVQAQELGIRSVALSGGEVLLRKDICDIFDHARLIGIKDLGVLSNGILINKNLHVINTYLLDNTITPVVSLDSLDEKVHNHIRNLPVAWQETTQGLRALALLKKVHPQINFNIISIILNENLEELPRLVDFALSLGANSLQFQALLSNNLVMSERKDARFWVSPERLGLLDEVVEKLIRLKEKHPAFIRNSVSNLNLVKKYYRGTLDQKDAECFSAKKTVLVSNQGTYVTCFSVYGNVREKALQDVLRGPEIVNARAALRQCRKPCLLPCFCD